MRVDARRWWRSTEDGALLEVTLTSRPQRRRAPRRCWSTGPARSRRSSRSTGCPPTRSGLPPPRRSCAAAATETPDRPLADRRRWDIREGTITGDGRLDRLGVIDGEPAAVVETTHCSRCSAPPRRPAAARWCSTATCAPSATTAFDLERRLRPRRAARDSEGTVDVLVAPPVGVLAPAVEALVTYELARHHDPARLSGRLRRRRWSWCRPPRWWA